MRRLALVALALVALAAPPPAAGSAGPAGEEEQWKVTITNLTPSGSQPLSPPLFVIHSNGVDVWSVGDIASHVVAAIAEDANNAPAESAIAQLPGVMDVFTGEGGPIPPGESRSYVVRTEGIFNRLTVLTMLVNTNDAFTGLDSFHVRPTAGPLRRMAYDAGSEKNNEMMEFIPGPCCGNPFVRDPEGELIRPHPGILGVGDLDPNVYGWTEPAAMITIEAA